MSTNIGFRLNVENSCVKLGSQISFSSCALSLCALLHFSAAACFFTVCFTNDVRSNA